MTIEELQTMAADLLEIIWWGIPRDYKAKYRLNIWEQFENQVRAAAYTSNLGKFINSLCSKFSAALGVTEDARARAEAILSSGEDRALLKLLREETTLIVLIVHVRRDEAREKLDEAGALDSLARAGRKFTGMFSDLEEQ